MMKKQGELCMEKVRAKREGKKSASRSNEVWSHDTNYKARNTIQETHEE